MNLNFKSIFQLIVGVDPESHMIPHVDLLHDRLNEIMKIPGYNRVRMSFESVYLPVGKMEQTAWCLMKFEYLDSNGMKILSYEHYDILVFQRVVGGRWLIYEVHRVESLKQANLPDSNIQFMCSKFDKVGF